MLLSAVANSSHCSSKGPLQAVTGRQGPLQSRCSTPQRAFSTATKQSKHFRRSASALYGTAVATSSQSSRHGPLQAVTDRQGPLQSRCSTPQRAFTTATKQSKHFRRSASALYGTAVATSSQSSRHGPLQAVTDRQGPLQSRCSTPQRAFTTATKQSKHFRRSASALYVVISSHSSSKGPLQAVTDRQGPLQSVKVLHTPAGLHNSDQTEQALQEISLR
ncbi:hypothetical protein ABBQ32_007463 [Trebouxia sp. C0010 RCD-2024]